MAGDQISPCSGCADEADRTHRPCAACCVQYHRVLAYVCLDPGIPSVTAERRERFGIVMRWIVGIDEVGRGALAGPVTVAAAMLATNTRGDMAHVPFRSLKDSKKLS